MSRWAEAAANAVASIHILYFLFVVVGLLLTLIGAIRRWRWIRNLWFRAAHVGAIAAVLVEDLMDWDCPLIPLEEWLRRIGGSASGAPTGPLGEILDRWLFGVIPPHWLNWIYAAGGVLVVALWLTVPPRNVIQSQSRSR